MKTLASIFVGTIAVAASATAVPLPTPAPYHPPAAVSAPPARTYSAPPTRSYNQAPVRSSSNYTPVHHSSQSSNSYSNGSSTRVRHSSSSSNGYTGTSTRSHSNTAGTSTTRHHGTSTGPVTSTHNPSTLARTSGTTSTGPKRSHGPIITSIGVPRHGTQVVRGPGASSGPQRLIAPVGPHPVTHTKANIAVDLAPYGPRPLIVPAVVSPGYGVAIVDPRVVGFYDGGIAQAEWSPEVETQWDTALETEFADMAVQDAGTPENPPAAAPVPEVHTRRLLAVSESDLAQADQLEYDALLTQALKLNTISDPDQAVVAENKFLKRSSRYLANHPDEVAIWVLRARLAVHINQENVGREAAENLKRLVDGGVDDAEFHGLMVELSARDWMATA